jgi:molybdenum cofactor cytidylyltransferase
MRGRDARADVCGIILAAGRSSRMGVPKQLLPLAGKPLLQHAIDAAAASSLGDIVVVLGRAAAEVEASLRLPDRARAVVNPLYETGIASSLQAGLRAAGNADAAATLLGDEPAVTPALIERVLAAWRASHAPIVRPVYTGGRRRRVPGHPVVIARSVWPSVETLRGDDGVRAIIAAHRDWLDELKVDAEAPADLDTPSDYERVRHDAGDDA